MILPRRFGSTSRRPLAAMITSGLLAAAAQAVEYPHWPAEYPLNAWDTLTSADVVGPDGLVYPDWSRVGVTGGIPDLALNDPADGTLLTVGGVQYKVFRVANFTHAGIGTALSSAKAWADGTKRAVVYLPAGTYTVGNASGHVIDENGIVIAGAGIGQTILNVANGNSGCVFNIDGNLGGAQSTVAQNAARGANSVVVASLSTFAVGQWVRIKNGTVLSAAKTMRARYSKEEIGIGFDNNTGKHFPRTFLARITAIDTGAKRLTFDRVLPHAYYADEATDIRQWSPVRFSGLQDFTMDFSLNTTSQNGVNLNDVADCWVKGVKLVKPTQWAIAAEGNHRANVEIRDCIFDGTKQALTSGGNAYLGWCNGDIDCLMVNVQANDHRHMGIFQAAMRNVVSGCTFSGTSVQSPQLHGRLPTDNLVENCTITATSIAGIYSDPVHSLEHGPNGPRNVFYNNTINLDGTVNNTGILFLAGALENPIFAYNRINGKDTWSEYWPTVRAWDRVFNAILIGNHLRALSNAPVLGLEDKSCDGWRVTDNTFYGATGQLSTGDGSIAMAHNNRFTSSTSIGTPTPPAASIWQWQVQNAASPRLVIVIDNKVVPENGGTTARIVRVQASTAASLTVSLSDDQGSLSSPASAVIPAGAKYVDVTLSAGALSGDLSATLTASASGLLGDTETVSLIDSASSVNFGSGHYAPAAISGETNWKLARLGRTQANGSASRSGGTWTLQGAGSYLNDPRTPAQNGYHFVQVPISGNGSITARFVSASGHQQVGVMVTDDLAHVTEMISLEPSKRMHSTCSHADYHADIKPYGQSTTGATSSHNGTWLRLTRNGAVFTAETSPDGTTWTKVSSTYRPYSATADITVNELDFYYPSPHAHYKSMAVLDDVMYFGIFVNSGSLTTLATATFDNVSTTGTVVSPSADTTPPTWASGYPQTGTILGTSIELRARTNENGNAYYVVLPDGATAPTAAQVKAGQNAAGGAPVTSGSMALTTIVEATGTAGGLSANTAYDIYLVAQDSATPPNVQASPVKLDVTTAGPQAQTITFDPLPDKTYGDAAISLTASASSGLAVSYSVVSGPATVSGATLTLTGAGSVTVRASQSGNAEWQAASPADQSFTVAQAALTVTADDKSRAVGADNPAWTVTYSGFVNGDDAGDLGGSLVFSGSATTTTAASPLGTYDIVPSGLTSANYVITHVAGTLTILDIPDTLPGDVIDFDETTDLNLFTIHAPVTAPVHQSGAGINGSGALGWSSSGSNRSAGVWYNTRLSAADWADHNRTITVTAWFKTNGDTGNADELASVGLNDTTASEKPDMAVSVRWSGSAWQIRALRADNGTVAGTAVNLDQTLLNNTWYQLSATFTKRTTLNKWDYSGEIRNWGADGQTGGGVIGTLTVTDQNGLSHTTADTAYTGFYFRANTTGMDMMTADNFSTTALGSTTSRQVQTITFPSIADKTYGAAAFSLDATASSSLPVSYSVVSGPATLSGSTLSITGTGTVTVQADQPGDAFWLPADPVQQTFTVAKAALTVTAADQTRYIGDPNLPWSASYSGFVANEDTGDLGGTLGFSGSATETNAASAAGTYAITPSGHTSDNYEITYVSGTLTILADTTPPAWMADHPLAGDVTSDSMILRMKIDEAGSGYYVVLPAGAAAPSSAQVKQGQDATGTAVSIAGTTALAAGTEQALLVGSLNFGTGYDVFSVAEDDSGNLQTAPVKRSITTLLLDQFITFPAIVDVTYGAPPVTLNASSDSGLAVEYTVVSGPATVSGNSLTVTSAGNITVRASQPGNSSYLPATPVEQSLTVAPAPLVITADDKSRAFGRANPEWTASYSGFVNGDTPSSLGGTLAFSGNATTTTTSSPEGTYTITPSGLTSANYDITFASGTLTITAATDPLLARWEMEEGTGTTSADSSGNSRPLTLGGGVTWSTNAKVGSRSLAFGGYATTTNNATFSAPAQANNLLTVEGWVFIDSANLPANNYPRLIETPGFMVSVNNATANPRRVEFNAKWGTAGKWTTPNNSFPVGEWVHVAVTYDASSTANDPVIYINGTAQTLVESPAPSGTAPTWTGTGVLGNRADGLRGLTGRLDDWSIRQSLLSASEVNSIMNSPPTITTISAQTIQANGATSALAFAIGDAQTAAASLTLSATSSNTSVVPNANLTLGGSGADRTITVVPAANQTGQTTITLTVSDGTLTANSTFTVTVTETPASWISGYPAVGSLTGATDDPDADGVPNLVEYALGGSPGDAASAPRPQAGISNSTLQLTFTPQRVSGLTYIIEASDNLSTWPDQTNVTSQLTPGQAFTHTDTAADPDRRFLRLRVSEP